MKVNQLKAGVILSYLQMGLGMIISLIYTPFMLRLLGQSEYGLYNISSSVISYLSLLNFGFGSSYVRYHIKYKKEGGEDKVKSLNGLFIIVFSLMGLIALIAGFILSMNCKLIFDEGLTNDELRITSILMKIMSVNMAISFPASVFMSYITAKEKFVFQKIVNMIKTVLNPFVTLVVLLMGVRSVGMSMVVTLFSFITDCIYIYFCIIKLGMSFSFKKLEFKVLKEIAAFSGFIALNMIVDEINWNVDKFLLGRFRGSVATSIYGVAATLNSYYRNISNAITNVFTPRVHKIMNEDDADKKITELFTRIGRIQFIILSLICSGFVFFGQRFVQLWAGRDYSEAYYIAILLMAPVTISLIQGLGIEIQRAKNMHKFRSVAYFFMSIVNVFISIPMCKALGEIGCAMGTAISIIIANGLVMNIYYNNKIHIDIVFFWKEILKIGPAFITPFIVGGIMRSYTIQCHLIWYIIMICIYVIIYFVSCWLLGMNSYEKGLVKSVFMKIK